MTIFDQINIFFEALQFEFSILAVIDIIIVAVIFYWIISGLRGTRGIRILWGLVILAVIFFIAQSFNFEALEWLLKASFAILVVAIPVVFQPELRKMLERAGRYNIFRILSKQSKEKLNSQAIRDIVTATKTLATNKTGGLIVICREDRLAEYDESGTALGAKISEALILNIFFPKSPLHDGAIIIRDNSIAAAGTILPLSESEKSYKFGTRHRAAIGIAEDTDALVIVISEERGVISVVVDDQLIEDVSSAKLMKLIRAKI